MRNVGARLERLEAEAEERLRAEVAAEWRRAEIDLRAHTREATERAWPVVLKQLARYATGDRRRSFLTAKRFENVAGRGMRGVFLRTAVRLRESGDESAASASEAAAAWFAFVAIVGGILPADLSRLTARERREWACGVESLRRDASGDIPVAPPDDRLQARGAALVTLLDTACPEWRDHDEAEDEGDGR